MLHCIKCNRHLLVDNESLRVFRLLVERCIITATYKVRSCTKSVYWRSLGIMASLAMLRKGEGMTSLVNVSKSILLAKYDVWRGLAKSPVGMDGGRGTLSPRYPILLFTNY
jgi:hypothetical protein